MVRQRQRQRQVLSLPSDEELHGSIEIVATACDDRHVGQLLNVIGNLLQRGGIACAGQHHVTFLNEPHRIAFDNKFGEGRNRERPRFLFKPNDLGPVAVDHLKVGSQIWNGFKMPTEWSNKASRNLATADDADPQMRSRFAFILFALRLLEKFHRVAGLQA